MQRKQTHLDPHSHWQAHCDGSFNGKTVNGYTQAWDFSNVTTERFLLNMFINDSSNQYNAGNGPSEPDSLRINKVGHTLPWL